MSRAEVCFSLKAYSNGSPYQPPSPYVRGTVFPLAPPTAHAIPSPHAGRARSSHQMWREYDLPPRAGGRWRAGSRERKELRGEAGGAGKLRDSASCWRRRKRALRRWRWRARGRRRPPPRGRGQAPTEPLFISCSSYHPGCFSFSPFSDDFLMNFCSS